MSGSTYNTWEDTCRGVVSSNAYFTQSGAIVYNYGSWIVISNIRHAYIPDRPFSNWA